MINGSSDFDVHGDLINYVAGDQHNHNQVHAETVFMQSSSSQVLTKYSKYDSEFQRIPNGDILDRVKVASMRYDSPRSLYRPQHDNDDNYESTTYTVNVLNQTSKFTAVTYKGKDGERRFEKDFVKFALTMWDDKALPELFGYNLSIPALIFHGELIPWARVFKKSLAGWLYIAHLKEFLNITFWELWVNTSNLKFVAHTFYHHPDILYPPIRPERSYPSNIPNGSEMMEPDTCFSFFQQYGSKIDPVLLEVAQRCATVTGPEEILRVPLPDLKEQYHRLESVRLAKSILMAKSPYQWNSQAAYWEQLLQINSIANIWINTIYYSPSMKPVVQFPHGTPHLWQYHGGMGLSEKTKLDGGVTRFTWDGLGNIVCCFVGDSHVWLSQSSRVFNYLNITDSKTSQDFYNLTVLVTFKGCRDPNNWKVRVPQPIYLFIKPLDRPLPLSEFYQLLQSKENQLYFCSFDETGASPCSKEECDRKGLPQLHIQAVPSLCSWRDEEVYTHLEKWQKAGRGFDPNTADWAKSMGYPELEILAKPEDFSRFEEIPQDNQAISSSSLPGLKGKLCKRSAPESDVDAVPNSGRTKRLRIG